MPVLSLFMGIMIKMYHGDHPPPHFHAFYGEFEAQVSISSGKILKGQLPPRIKKLVNEWRKLHKSELEKSWELAQSIKPLKRIKPLE
jgi:hypothetical protein